MKTSTKIYGGALLLLMLFLLTRARGFLTAYMQPPITLPGLPNVTYDIPAPVITMPTGSMSQADFDWLGEQCGCDGNAPINAILIDSVSYTRNEPSFQYVEPLVFDYTQALKGAANLTANIAPPASIIYRAATPSFWWGWIGLRRVIFTSDGFTLPLNSQDQGGMNRAAILDSRTWADVTPGRNALTQITVIRFNAQDYVLDASRSTGL